MIIVTPEQKLHFIPLQVGKDNGVQIEIKSGLNGQERIVSNPTDQMQEGQKIEILKSAPQ